VAIQQLQVMHLHTCTMRRLVGMKRLMRVRLSAASAAASAASSTACSNSRRFQAELAEQSPFEAP
jgi:hypothetical protein